MTNLYKEQEKRKKLITPENAVLFIPIFISIILFLGIVSAFTIPQSLKIKKKLEQIKFLEEKISYIPIYNNKLKEIKIKKNKALGQQGRLLSLVAGEKDLKTLLNKLNSITVNNKVKIIEVKPIVESKIILSEKTDDKKGRQDPLLQPSLEKYSFTLMVEGKYNDIIGMLKDIEMLETFVIAKNLKVQSVKTIQPSSTNDSKQNNNNILTKLTIELTAYGKKIIKE